MAKLSALQGAGLLPHRYERVWWREQTTGPARIVAAASEDQVETALALASVADGPLILLWVLHTPRGGSQAGRYQSPPIAAEDVRRLLREYRELFEHDGRSDLWLHAPASGITIVIDRHDLIYAYGPEQAFIDALGSTYVNRRTSIPAPHAHHYKPEFDALERRFAAALEWRISALRPEDEP